MNSIRVLVVDDDAIICKLLVTFLQYHGYDAVSVGSGEEALQLLDENHFQVVITDLKMGDVDGFDVIRHVVRIESETVMIMITGSCTEETRAKAFELGVHDFFCKPFALAEILDSLPSVSMRFDVLRNHSHLSL